MFIIQEYWLATNMNKNFINPLIFLYFMEGKYQLTGHYTQNGVRGQIDGNLSVNACGYVTGTITDKLAPPDAREREVSGRAVVRKGVLCLGLVFRVPSDDLLNIVYALTKPTTAVEGAYTGAWLPIEKVIDARFDGRSFESSDGETWFHGQFKKLVPYKKDMVPQPVEVTLKKAA